MTKWNLVCGQKFKVSLVISMYMLGLMIGSFICGTMADKFGRKKTLFCSVLCSSCASLLGSFMPEYYSYTASRLEFSVWKVLFIFPLFRLVTAIGAQGLFLSTFSLAVEVVGSKEKVPFLPWVTYQTFFGVMIQAPFSVG